MQKYKTLLGDEPGLKHNYGSLRSPVCGNCSQEPGGEVVGKEQQKYFT